MGPLPSPWISLACVLLFLFLVQDSFFVGVVEGQSYIQNEKVTVTSGPGVGQIGLLGRCVVLSTDGRLAVLGAPGEGGGIGAAYVYSRSCDAATGPRRWNVVARLVPSDPSGNSSFGFSCATSSSGSVIVIGGELDNNQTGAAWVFVQNGTGNGWTQVGKKIVGPGYVKLGPNGVAQGGSVAVSRDGSTVVIGGRDDNNGVGQVWIYTHNAVFNNYTLFSRLTGASTSNDGGTDYATKYPDMVFGDGLAIDSTGARIAVGASDAASSVGGVFVFTRSGATYGQESPKLDSDWSVQGYYSQIGVALAMTPGGDVLAAGAPNDGSSGFIGAMYIFTRSGSTWAAMYNSGGTAAPLGYVGTPYQFQSTCLSGAYLENPCGVGQGFAIAMSDDGLKVAVGAPYNNNTVGGVYLFSRSGSTWAQYGSMVLGSPYSGLAAGIFQGRSVALSGDGSTLAIGADRDNFYRGSVFFFSNKGFIATSSSSCTLVNTAAVVFTPLGVGGSTCVPVMENNTCCTPACGAGYSPVLGAINNSVSCVNAVASYNASAICLPLPCAVPSPTGNTTYASCGTGPIQSGLSCTPTCQSGYVAVGGSLTIQCTATVWSAPVGSCQPAPCLRPSETVATTYLGCPVETASGSSCVPTCKLGYTASASLALNCSYGNFSASAGDCLGNPCLTPPVDTTAVTYANCSGSTASGGLCFPDCQPGYSVSSGNLVIQCVAGAWTSSSGVCTALPCQLTVPTNTTLGTCAATGTVLSGTTCYFGCLPGFVASGSLLVSCLNSVQTGPSGFCFNDTSASLCSLPTPPSPFTPGGCPDAAVVGSQCEIGCADGYTAVGNLTAVCQSDLHYHYNSNISCQPNSCLFNLKAYVQAGFAAGGCPSSIASGATCALACRSGFTALGNTNITCTAGNFSTPLGSCQPNPCGVHPLTQLLPAPAPYDYGTCSIGGLNSGSGCSLSCSPSYSQVGNLTVLCYAGQFSMPPGLCIGMLSASTSSLSSTLSTPDTLITTPGTAITFTLDARSLPSDLVVTNFSVANGGGVVVAFGIATSSPGVLTMPDMGLNATTGMNEGVLHAFVSSASAGLNNVLLSAFDVPIVFYHQPVLYSACPNNLQQNVPVNVSVNGQGFARNSVISCVLAGQYRFPATVNSDTVVGCVVTSPLPTQGNVPLSVANDGSVDTLFASTNVVQMVSAGGCQLVKAGSVATPNGCECPAGTYDTGSSCSVCPIGTYAATNGSLFCTPCPANEDTYKTVGAVSASSCVCQSLYFRDYLHHAGACVPCVTGMYCPGNQVVEILPGYWRANANTSKVVQCAAGANAAVQRAVCPGTVTTSASNSSVVAGDMSLCGIGYTGPICAVCAVGYAKLGAYQCVECPRNGLNVLVLVVLVGAAAFFAYGLIKFAQVGGDVAEEENRKSKHKQGSLGVIFKVTLNYLQMLYYVGRLSANWNQVATQFFSIVGIVGALSPNNYSVRCAATWSYYDSIFFIYISPLLVVGILGIVYLVRHLLYRLPMAVSLMDYQKACMLLLYQLHPTILLELITSFRCVHVAGLRRSSFLQHDMSVDCNSAQYKTHLAASAVYLVVYILGLVVLVLWRLRHSYLKGALHSATHSAYRKYSFFILGYKEDFYFWEAMIILQKMTIVAFSTVASAGLQLVFVSVVITLSLIGNLVFAPFSSPSVNRLQSLTLSALYTTVVLGFLFLLTTGSNTWIAAVLIILHSCVLAVLMTSYVSRAREAVATYLPRSWSTSWIQSSSKSLTSTLPSSNSEIEMTATAGSKH